jgi:hypothetical protein
LVTSRHGKVIGAAVTARESIMMLRAVTIPGAALGQIWKVWFVVRSEGRIVDAAGRRDRPCGFSPVANRSPPMFRSLPRIGARARGFVIAILVVRKKKLSH